MASLFKRSGWYYVQFYSSKRTPQRKQVALNTTTKRVAEKLQKRLEDSYALGEFDPWAEPAENDTRDLGTLEKAVDAFLDAKSTASASYRRNLAELLAQFKRHVSPATPPTAISSRHVKSFLDATRTNAVSRKTYVRHLRVFFRWLVKQEVIGKDVTCDVPLRKVPNKFPKYLMPDEVDKLLQTIEKEAEDNNYVQPEEVLWLKAVIEATVNLGLRRGEVCSLRWSAVDLDGRMLTVANTRDFTTKSGSERKIPIPDGAFKVLARLNEERRSECPDAYVFTHSKGKIEPHYLSRRFREFRRKADLPEHITFHSLRHTTASWLVMNGASLEAVRQFLGHSSITVTQKYAHLAPNVFFDQVNRALRGS